MKIQSVDEKRDKIVSELGKLADEKEILLDITAGLARRHLMEEIGVIRTSLDLIRQLDMTRLAYEEMLAAEWAHGHSSNFKIITGENK